MRMQGFRIPGYQGPWPRPRRERRGLPIFDIHARNSTRYNGAVRDGRLIAHLRCGGVAFRRKKPFSGHRPARQLPPRRLGRSRWGADFLHIRECKHGAPKGALTPSLVFVLLVAIRLSLGSRRPVFDGFSRCASRRFAGRWRSFVLTGGLGSGPLIAKISAAGQAGEVIHGRGGNSHLRRLPRREIREYGEPA